MKWMENLRNLANDKPLGNCPFCKSDDIDYSIQEVNGGFGYGVIWCNSCKRAYHISRLKTDSFKDNINKSIPDDLKF